MYPLDDICQRAVAAYQDGERREAENSADARPSLDAIRVAVGLEPVPLNRESIEDCLKLSSALIASRTSLVDGFRVLQAGPGQGNP